MTPEDLMHDLRSRINTQYSKMIGTESHERKQSADAIELLIGQRDSLAAELAKVKAERDALQKRIDGGIRARTSKAHYDSSDQLIWANNEDDDKYNNSTIILDEGVKL